MLERSKEPVSRVEWLSLLAIILLGYLISHQNYLLFHSVAEIFCVLIGGSICLLTWTARRQIHNPYLLFVGIGYFFVGFFDLIHALAFEGMGVFDTSGANLATQVWVAGRMLEALTLVVAVLQFRRPFAASLYALGGMLMSTMLLGLIFYWALFPICYVAGEGLTAFKLWAETGIIITLIVAMALLFLFKEHFDEQVRNLMFGAIALTVAAELCFMLYKEPTGLANQIGHLIKVGSYYLVYKAIIETGLKHPYQLLFRELKAHQQELERALEEVRTLHGLLPICAQCKKIRDDDGAWQQMEAYLSERAEVVFSHGYCPDCAAAVRAKWMPKSD